MTRQHQPSEQPQNDNPADEHSGGTITLMVVQKRNKERVNIHLDGEFAFGLTINEAMKLRKGQKLTAEDVVRLKALDEVAVAHDRALNFLSYRPRSIAEVRQNLRDKDISEVAVEEVISRLVRVGLLDDVAFARYWVENRDRFKPRGERALRYELRRKGVPDEALDLAVEEIDADDAAYRAAAKRARRYRKADVPTFKKKMLAYLTRLGFDYGTSRDVVEQLLEEREQQEDDVISS